MVWETARTIATVGAALMVLSGVAGVAVGGPSAAAGWWLIVVSGVLLVAILVEPSRRAM